MICVTRSELNRMAKNVLDRETGMTELDYFENQHSSEDWNIIEDEELSKAAYETCAMETTIE